ncbi:MAG: ribose 5-phosphate isomerase B [Candidatus Omnitrophica bacterium]|nr:ribose 5-phosphate isomerase B [Candidatus Omnitrophota bacterium]
MVHKKSGQARGIAHRVAVGADHGGFELKAKVVAWLSDLGYEVADLGTHSPEACDYPAIGFKVAQAVASGSFSRGVLLCKSGVGIAIAANKVPGIRAAVCHDLFDAERSRSHNDANVLVLGAERLPLAAARRIVAAWFATPFESGGRHERRVRQIAALERKILAGARAAAPATRSRSSTSS